MRVLVSLALIASGVVAVLADAQRWSPACAGGFDELDCLLLQDHMYDFALPAEPWVPIGTSAHLMALNYALLAVAMLGFARALVRAWWAWFLGAPFALSFVVLAVTTYRSAIAGRVVEPDGFGYDVALYTYILPWPAALLLGSAVGGLPLRSSVVRGARAVAAPVLLALTSPFPLYFVASIAVFYASHDTSPWDVAVGGVLTALAGLALLTARRHVLEPEWPRPRRPSAPLTIV